MHCLWLFVMLSTFNVSSALEVGHTKRSAAKQHPEVSTDEIAISYSFEIPPCFEGCLSADPCAADSTCYSSCNQCQKTYMSDVICGSFSYSYESSYACGDLSYSYDLWRWSYSFEMPPCLEDCLSVDPCADGTCYSSCNECEKTYMSDVICGSFSYSYESSHACGDLSYSYDIWRWSYSFEMPPCLEDCLFTDPCADSTCYSSCNQCHKTYMIDVICGSFSYSYDASYLCGDINYPKTSFPTLTPTSAGTVTVRVEISFSATAEPIEDDLAAIKTSVASTVGVNETEIKNLDVVSISPAQFRERRTLLDYTWVAAFDIVADLSSDTSFFTPQEFTYSIQTDLSSENFESVVTHAVPSVSTVESVTAVAVTRSPSATPAASYTAAPAPAPTIRTTPPSGDSPLATPTSYAAAPTLAPTSRSGRIGVDKSASIASFVMTVGGVSGLCILLGLVAGLVYSHHKRRKRDHGGDMSVGDQEIDSIELIQVRVREMDVEEETNAPNSTSFEQSMSAMHQELCTENPMLKNEEDPGARETSAGLIQVQVRETDLEKNQAVLILTSDE